MSSKFPLFTILLAGLSTAQAQSILAPKDKPAANAPAVLLPIPSDKKPVPAPISVPSVKAPTPAASAAPAAAKPSVAAAPAAAPAPRPQVIVLPAAGSSPQGAVTIADLAARQAQKMAAQTAPVASAAPVGGQVYRQVVPEVIAAAPIPVVMDGQAKPSRSPKKAEQRTYLASIIGLRGEEVVEIQTGEGPGHTLKTGDSIANWSISRIADGKLFLTSAEYSKKTRRTETRSKVLSVGDSL